MATGRRCRAVPWLRWRGSPFLGARRAGDAAVRRHAVAGADAWKRDAPLFAAAMSLARWHSRHRFCANCGHATEIIRGGWSRSCPACSAEHFPRVDPVVIMLVEHDGKLLLGRHSHWPEGRYSALAGFVEVGESVEAAVIREVKEEAGIDVGSVRYVASQPWPFPSSLMIACKAEAIDARAEDRHHRAGGRPLVHPR